LSKGSGQAGSKRYARHYSDKLVCVKCRGNTQTNARVTTIEIIIHEQALIAQPKITRQYRK